MTQSSSELLVIDKTYELVLWSCRHIAGFPRSHRFTLGERMELRLYELLELLLKAKYSGRKAGLLRQANMELELLRGAIRPALFPQLDRPCAPRRYLEITRTPVF